MARKDPASLIRVIGLLAAGLPALAGCGDDSGKAQDSGPPPGDGTGGLHITITSPLAGATDVSVTSPKLEATFSQVLADPDQLKVVLIKDQKKLYGSHTYSATELTLTFTPFNMLQSRASYTFQVQAEGVTASVSFSTAKTNEGGLAQVAGKTYDFRIKKISYPEDLAAIFNAQLKSAPPVLMHVVSVTDQGSKDGNSLASFVIAGSTGKVGDPVGKSQVLAEDSTHTTTTAMAISGSIEGTFMAAGPSDLHLTASGIPLVIRDFYVTGVFAASGSSLSQVALTGLIDPVELGKALGGLDLSFICTDDRFKKFCDEKQRIRVAAAIDVALNPISFTTFITKPVNASSTVETTTTVVAYFSEEVDSLATTVKLTDAKSASVSGKLSSDKKSLTFTPGAALQAKTQYQVEVAGKAKTKGTGDTRHLAFTTK